MQQFEECCEYTLDKFWKEKFKKCSLGKFPPGIMYDSKNHVITLTNKKNREIVKLSRDDSISVFKTMMDIFQNKLGIHSPREKSTEVSQKVDPYESWLDIKYNCVKKELICNYVMKKGLSNEEKKKLFCKIQLGFLFKYIDSSCVTLENGEITHIEMW